MNLHDWYKRVDLASLQAAKQRGSAPPGETPPDPEGAARKTRLAASVATDLGVSAVPEPSGRAPGETAGEKPHKSALRRVEGAVRGTGESVETREQLLSRLLDPILSLEEAAKVLNVCPTTVRRYTNSGALSHLRTQGNQRRFLLSDVLAFLKSQQEGMPNSRVTRSVPRRRTSAGQSSRDVAEVERGS